MTSIGHVPMIRRLARQSLVRHIVIAMLATGLVVAFAATRVEWSPMHRWNRAFGDASFVLVALSMGLVPLMRLLRAAAFLRSIRATSPSEMTKEEIERAPV